jgi:uridine kinase
LLNVNNIFYFFFNNLFSNKTSIYNEISSKDSHYDVIIVEGVLALYNESVRNLFDLKIYLDTDDDVRLSRRGTSHNKKFKGM